MPNNRLWDLIRARWGVIASVWTFTMLTTLGISLVLPPQYVATASLVLDVKPDPIAGSYPGLLSSSLVNTQVDVIGSERVARRVIRNLRLLEQASLRDVWERETQRRMPMETWLLDGFRRRLEIRPSRDSNVIQVGWRGQDAKGAAQMANGFVQAYLDTALELRTDPARQFASFFDERSREARQALQEAQTRLSELQQRRGLVATDERLDLETARLAELSSQLSAAQAQRSDAASRVKVAQTRPLSELPDVMANSLIAGLRAEHSRLSARLQELDERLGPQHPQRLEMAAGLAEVQARIDDETRRIGAGLQAQQGIASARVTALQGEVAAQRQRVMDLKAGRDEAAVLAREVDAAQRAYDAVVGRQQVTRLESQTTQAQANWLSVALPPTEPDSPRVVLNMVLATFFGALLALAVALWLQSRHPGPADLPLMPGT